MEKIKRVLVNVYRNGLGDCTNNGLTSRVSSSWLFVDCSREEALQLCEKEYINPYEQMILVRRTLWGRNADYAEPLMKKAGHQMFGGNFIYTSDSRFSEWTGSRAPIAVHDRFETREEYDFYSK